jgi:hypothetical protein
MTGSSNLRDAISKSIEESSVTVEEKAEPEVATPEVQPETETEPEEVVESFAEKGDLKGKTAEQLEEIYQTWNKAYTQKRQSETEEIKAIRLEKDQLAQRLQDLEAKVSTQPQHVAQEYQGEQDELLQLLQQGQISPADYHQRLKIIIDSQARAVVREEFKNLSSEHEEESRQQTALSEVNGLDDRFNENSPTHDKAMHRSILADVGEELGAYLAKNNNSSQGFDHKAVANRLISEWDSRIDAQVKERTQKSTQVARDNAGKFAKQNPKGSPANSVSTEPKNLRDIFAEQIAKQGG